MINRKYAAVAVGIASILFALATPLQAAPLNTANNETGTDQINTGCSIRIQDVGSPAVKWEYFRVPKDAANVVGGEHPSLSPRAERGLTGSKKISGANITDGKKVITMKGKIKVNNAAQTTIMQIYNWDTGSTDSGVPYARLDVKKKTSTGKWQMEIREAPSSASGLFELANGDFEIEFKTNNRKVRLKVTQNGATVINRKWDIPSDRLRIGRTSGVRAGTTTFRFGAYHHDSGTDKAEIRFRDMKVTETIYTTTTAGDNGV